MLNGCFTRLLSDDASTTLSDHLGSTSVTANANGGLTSKTCYTAFGETRPCPGAVPPGANPTDYLYTGQRLEAEIGLYFYNARFYDAKLGRFAQADTLIPGAGNPLALDRYAYVQNNSLRYTDPSGHYYMEDPGSIYVPPPPPLTSYRVHPPSDFEASGLGSQYMVVPSQDYIDRYGRLTEHKNLCGHLSAAAIYETVTGETNSLGPIWEAVPTTPSSAYGQDGEWLTDSADWINYFNDFPGWSAESKWFDWRNPYQDVAQTFKDGNYVILGNVLDTVTGRMVSEDLRDGERYIGHWAVIVDAEPNSVTIWNPYAGFQTYSWKEFTATDSTSIVISPPRYTSTPKHIPE